MLVNVSYNKPDLDRLIDSEVGPAFSLLDRIKRGGIGSPKLWIESASEGIRELLERDINNNTCNIELRPSGLILRFRSLLETYAFVLPFSDSDIRMDRDGSYRLSRASNHILIHSRRENARRYFNRLFREQDAIQ
jgi:hypothetical protein